MLFFDLEAETACAVAAVAAGSADMVAGLVANAVAGMEADVVAGVVAYDIFAVVVTERFTINRFLILVPYIEIASGYDSGNSPFPDERAPVG